MPMIKPIRGSQLIKAHPLARGLVGCWLFNEGTGNKVFDLSGNGNDGTITGALWDSGESGSALSFTDDIVDCGYKSSIANLTELTIVAKVLTTGLPGAGNFYYAVCQRNNVSNRFNFSINGDHSNNWAFGLVTSGTAALAYSSAVPTLNQWYDIAVTYSDSGDRKPRLYVDGVEDSGSQSTATGTIVSGTNVPISIGNKAVSLDRDWHGKIEYAMIFNRALSAFEIAQLYREPFCMFERAWIPKLIGGQIVELIGTSAALSSLSATTKAIRKVGGNVAGTSDVVALLHSIRSLPVIERIWLREALSNGMTANAFKLGTTLSLGWFWVRVAGCSALYRGSSIGETDFLNILAVTEQDAREISPPSYISHNSGSTYFYVVRRFNNCGYQERTLAASVKVSIESNGELAEPQPNKVFDSGAELIDGNKIQLVWYYCPLEQKSQPMCFNVYYDGRTGQIDYENHLATIEYQGRKFYSYQSSALEAGKYLFAIRAEDAGGIENSSLARLGIQFDTTNPNAIDILSAEAV